MIYHHHQIQCVNHGGMVSINGQNPNQIQPYRYHVIKYLPQQWAILMPMAMKYYMPEDIVYRMDNGDGIIGPTIPIV
ncbi:hypothetical protein BLA29_014245 [Euroglyphus maynei]|uniref:Uncharacterized protein n=1 Tax=Euroglyphus maynei TaxID=6958 RepID=A0A1Y3AU80_EURMA|nr:hypothetical protein BLA29_014245 [Euroglyphus maynei]